MARFFEVSPVVGITANGDAFVVEKDDVLDWGKGLASYIQGFEDEAQVYRMGGSVEVAFYDSDEEQWYSRRLGEADFWLPEVFCESFCKWFAGQTGCACA